MRKDLIFVVSVVIILMTGAFISYGHNPFKSELKAEINGNNIAYEITSNYGSGFSTVSIKNEKEVGPKKYLIYNDTKYAIPISNRVALNHVIDSLERNLRICSGISVDFIDSDGLKLLVEKEMGIDFFETAVIFLTGAMPDTVYNGTLSSPLLVWLSSGGMIYWCGQPFGKYVSTPTGVQKISDYSSALFGSTGVFRDVDDEPKYSRIAVNMTNNNALSIHYNDITYGANTDKIGHNSFSIGYVENNFRSVSFMKFGDGVLSYFGGYISYSDIQNLVLAITFRLNHTSEITEHQKGLITNKHAYGKITADRTNTTVIIYLGDFKINKIWALFPGNDVFI